MTVIVRDKKNGDIQLLRATAIIAVLGFHLRPELVPQGYLGVDIFFAISGYLMTVILKGKQLTFQNCCIFYERRLKRLLPAYSIVIFGTLAVAAFFLISTDYDFLKTDVIWSMGFVTNFQSIFEKQTYFLLVNDFKFLLHTWSLSVEMQYYLLVPWSLIPILRSRRTLPILIGLSLASGTFQTFIPYSTISFGLVFSRIWQFLIGSIVHHLQNVKSIPTEPHKATTEIAWLQKLSFQFSIKTLRATNFMLIFVICFMPELSTNHLYQAIVRLIATILGGAAILFGTWSTSYGPWSLLAQIGTYIGDISYSMYLVHWPLIILAKYCNVFDSMALWKLLAIIIAISLAQYHFFEKPVLHLSSKITFFISGLLYLGLLILLIQPQGLGYIKLSIDPAVKDNEQIAKKCEALPMIQDCNWDSEMLTIAPRPTKAAAFFCSYDGPGNLTVFFTGNSYALRQLAGIKEALKGQYKKLYFAARPACLAFESFNRIFKPYWQCGEIENKTVEFLEMFRPDLLIISQKLSGNRNFTTHIPPKSDDPTTQEVARYLQKFSNFTQKIIIIEPHPTFPYNPAITLAKNMAQGISIEDKFLSKENVASQVDPGWFRIKAAMKECPKCSAIDVRNVYFENDKYYAFDRKTKLSLFCDNNHFSYPGVQKMLPILKEAFGQAIAKIKR